MAKVTGLTADRMLSIEAATVIGVRREGDDIIFITNGGIETNLGDFKGGKGDVGDIGLQRIDVTYAESEDGVTPPEDGYTTTVPLVTSGWYLWTKFEFISSDNSVTVSYTNSRMGVDGAISSVNGKTDANVVLEASDVGAVSNTDPDYRIWPGTIWEFGGDIVPPTWVECDGQYYEQDEHPELYAAIGTRWGSSSATNFRVPPFNGRSTVGVDPTNPDLDEVGKTYGSKTRLLTSGQIPELLAASAGAHGHTATINSGGAHTHGVGGLGRIMTTDRVGLFTQKDGSVDPKTTAVTPAYGAHTSVSSEALTASSGAHAHTATIASAGAHDHRVNVGSQSELDIMHPVAVVRKMIKL